jgi:hypothetical protein
MKATLPAVRGTAIGCSTRARDVRVEVFAAAVFGMFLFTFDA